VEFRLSPAQFGKDLRLQQLCVAAGARDQVGLFGGAAGAGILESWEAQAIFAAEGIPCGRKQAQAAVAVASLENARDVELIVGTEVADQLNARVKLSPLERSVRIQVEQILTQDPDMRVGPGPLYFPHNLPSPHRIHLLALQAHLLQTGPQHFPHNLHSQIPLLALQACLLLTRPASLPYAFLFIFAVDLSQP
jgi:hypothetical protein